MFFLCMYKALLQNLPLGYRYRCRCTVVVLLLIYCKNILEEKYQFSMTEQVLLIEIVFQFMIKSISKLSKNNAECNHDKQVFVGE